MFNAMMNTAPLRFFATTADSHTIRWLVVSASLAVGNATIRRQLRILPQFRADTQPIMQ